MKFKHISLIEGIVADAVRSLCVVSGLCLGSMITHEPGANAFTLLWEPAKIVPYLPAWAGLVLIFSVHRHRRWKREWDEKIALALGADGEEQLRAARAPRR